MSQKQSAVTQEQCDQVGAKLRAFYDALSEDEQRVMAAIMDRASGSAEVTGHVVTKIVDKSSPDSPTVQLPPTDQPFVVEL